MVTSIGEENEAAIVQSRTGTHKYPLFTSIERATMTARGVRRRQEI
jgi:hypothetical protein